jgi:signal transduction histidine kinase
VVGETLEQVTVPPNVTVEVGNLDGMSADLDPLQIQTALGNLVRNAAEAMRNGGTLCLEAADDDETIRLVVSDSGPGVTPERRAKLFDPLVTTKPMGSGLGLSTARLLVENHQGTIRCDASALGGAKFTIELPRRRAD